jgi:hypothetical protein
METICMSYLTAVNIKSVEMSTACTYMIEGVRREPWTEQQGEYSMHDL